MVWKPKEMNLKKNERGGQAKVLGIYVTSKGRYVMPIESGTFFFYKYRIVCFQQLSSVSKCLGVDHALRTS